MRLSNSGPPRGVQDRAEVVATTVLTTVLRHLRDHWDRWDISGLRSELVAILRDEFTGEARMARDEIRESE
jgi:hypothetical protein